MQKKVVLLFFFLLTSVATEAQPLKPYLFDGSCPHLTNYFQYLEDCNGFTTQEVLSQYYGNHFLKPEPNTTFNKGFTQCSYWLAIEIKNVMPKSEKFIWSFYNNGLEFEFYELKAGKLVFIDKSSMYKPLKERPYPVRSISFPFLLNHNETKTLFVRVSTTTHGNIYFPTDITYVEDYLWYEIDFSFLMGKYFGILFLAFFINLSSFIILRQRIFLYTMLYVFFVTIFMLSDFHFDSIQIENNSYFKIWSHVNKGFYISIACFFYLKIFELFTNQKEVQPLLSQWLKKYSLLLIIAILVEFLLSFTIPFPKKMLYLLDIIGYIINSFGFLLLLVSLVYGIYRKKTYFIYFLITSVGIIYGFITYILNTINLVNLPIIFPGNVINGLVIEISLLTIFLIYKYKIEKENYAASIINKAKQNESLTLLLLESQEKERKAIAEDLHDDIGSGLTGLRLTIQNKFNKSNIPLEDQNKILEQFKYLYEKVRTISHQLKPKEFESNSFKEVIEDKINFYKTNFDNIQLLFITNIGDKFVLDENIETTLYRIILELLSNAYHHANASNITLQIFEDTEKLTICIEDDGIGFDTNAKFKGIGLANLKSRVDYLKGKITVESNKKGTTFIIEVPTLQ